MNPEAVRQAEARLRRADRHVQILSALVGFDELEEAWCGFLSNAHTVSVKLQRGTHGHPRSLLWYSRLARDRKSDPLLQYIHQARNADEHNLSPTLILVGKTGVLQPAENRGDAYAPPGEHLGTALDDATPAHVAKLGSNYLYSIVNDAKRLIQRGQ
tara:strand:+ start:350 stop:820 length:471 start_codon:yes stop_codon:yes gene_type:complete